MWFVSLLRDKTGLCKHMILSWGTNPPKGQHQELFLTDRVMEKLLSLAAGTEILLPDFRLRRISLIGVMSSRIAAQCQHTAVCEGRLQQRLSSELTTETRASFSRRSVLFWLNRRLQELCRDHGCPQLVAQRYEPSVEPPTSIKCPILCTINITIPICVSRL